MPALNRRNFLHSLSITAAPVLLGAADSFFRVTRHAGRWWFLDPSGKHTFSLGLNHLDPATLRYGPDGGLWHSRYSNNMERWLRDKVRPDLLRWGFNCLGWNQEVIVRGPTNHSHSRPFTFDEYQWLGLPYCHLLPFTEFHQWEAQTRHPDLFATEFEDWCDHVAREHCVPFARDPKLIGYFYVDCPTWVHTRPENEWKGPLFDPARLTTEAGRKELTALATRYYKVTHDAIRRYDRNHLILGDRYEAAAALPEEVVLAARPYIDVLSFQQFGAPAKVRADFDKWRGVVDLPILLADGAGNLRTPSGVVRHDTKKYADVMAVLRDNPNCVGFHLCGAYQANRVRRRGLLDEQERPDEEVVAAITAVNRETTRWAERAAH
ncbi:MAG: agarase [Bryobacterales bacterium]|nr:agarase [Bryobacterales bacterium]